MKVFIILSAAFVFGLAAPEGYKYKLSAPAIEHGHHSDFQPIASNRPPCSHAAQYTREWDGAASALIQSQSTGRIVNQGDHNLDAAASGHSQAVTVNSHIVVGDGSSTTSGQFQQLHNGQGLFGQQALGTFQQQLPENHRSHPQFHALPQTQSQFTAQPFNPTKLIAGQVVPSQVVAGHTGGYVYGQSGNAEQSVRDLTQQHYVSSASSSIINGVGKVPPPLPHFVSGSAQYASGYVGNKVGNNHSPNGAPAHGLSHQNAPVQYRPVRPTVPVSFASNQIDSNSYAGKFEHNSNSYAGSFNQNSHHAQFNQGNLGSTISGSVGSYGGSQLGLSSNQAGSLHTANGLFGSSHILNNQIGNVIRETFANTPLDPTAEKHIYVHVPPEDLDESSGKHYSAVQGPQAPPKKHYKIIFIKAPTVAQPNYAQIAAAAPQTEEKTLVYVLVKKPDEPSIEEIQQIQQTAFKPSKPEVYFIKYKTRKEEEAKNTQFNVESNTDGGNFNSGSNETDDIDIRLGGKNTFSSSSSSSYSSSSSNSISAHDGSPKHELYGVPLE